MVDPGAVVAGTTGLASWGNAVRNALLWLKAGPANRCTAYNNAAASVTAGNSTTLTMNSEDVDTASMHSTSSNTERITVPAGAGGAYYVSARTRVIATSGNPAAYLHLRKNGSTIRTAQVGLGDGHPHTLEIVVLGLVLAAGEYVDMVGEASAGGNVDFGSATAALSWRLEVVGPQPPS